MTMSSMPIEMPARGRVAEAEVLDLVEHLDRDLETEAQVAVVAPAAPMPFFLSRPLMNGMPSGR